MLLLLLLSHFSRVQLCATPIDGSTPGPAVWDSPGKTTGVGCHFLLQRMKVKSERSRHSVQSMTKAAWEYSTQVLLERKQEERRSKERKDRLVEGPHYKSSI